MRLGCALRARSSACWRPAGRQSPLARSCGSRSAAGVVYLQANAQTAPVRQPLITEALVDVEHSALTINGYDFPASVPEVTLGMTELAVVSVTESAMLTGLPELQSGTYLLAATWTKGVGAIFYLTVGAVGPAGPQGTQGPQGFSAPFLSSVLESPSPPAPPTRTSGRVRWNR